MVKKMDDEAAALAMQAKKDAIEKAREYERTIEKQQKQRNRNIVRDIITTCNDYRSTIKDDINNMRGEEEDA